MYTDETQSEQQLTEVLQETVAVATTALSEAPIAPRQSKKAIKQQQAFAKMFKDYQDKQRMSHEKMLSRVRVLKTQMNAEDFKNLADICTIKTSEEKNEQGEVTKEASSQVNYKALLAEGALVLVLNREERIKAGTRKRSSGRRSKRSAHANTIKFINMRNKTLQSESVV